MFARSNLGQVAIVSSTCAVSLTVSWAAMTLPVFAEEMGDMATAQSVDWVVESAVDSAVSHVVEQPVGLIDLATESAVIDNSATPLSAEDRNVAMLELAEAIAADQLAVEILEFDSFEADSTETSALEADSTEADSTEASVLEADSPEADALEADSTEGNALEGNALEAAETLTSGTLESVAISTDSIQATDPRLSSMGNVHSISAESLPALSAALDSDNALTQLYAADTLWTLTGDRDLILPTLVSAVASENLQVRELAISGLAYLGEQALPALPLLNRLVGNSDSRTRQLAQDALSVVTSGTPASTALGIVVRESRRLRIVPTVIRAITGLWRR